MGDFEQLYIGTRADLRLEITRIAGDSTGGAFRAMQVWLRAYLRTDVALARPEHFVVIDGIIPLKRRSASLATNGPRIKN